MLRSIGKLQNALTFTARLPFKVGTLLGGLLQQYTFLCGICYYYIKCKFLYVHAVRARIFFKASDAHVPVPCILFKSVYKLARVFGVTPYLVITIVA